VEAELGPIEIWVNNAMVSVFGPVDQATPEEFRRVTEVTYLGTVYGTLEALSRMNPRGRGKIIQVGSALAYRGIPMQAAYCAAKHATQGFTESLRTELMHDGSSIGLTMVQLPALNTPQFDWVKSRLDRQPQPVPPIFQPEVAAQAIVWAASQDKREIMVGGSTVQAVVGNKIAPALGDRYLARHGIESQQTDEPEDPERPHNLHRPVPGLHRTRGRFESRAKDFSLQLWCVMHPIMTAAVVAGVALGVLVISLLIRQAQTG
jgi:short-subunit dehydrogenase